jgi:hypothetical protein
VQEITSNILYFIKTFVICFLVFSLIYFGFYTIYLQLILNITELVINLFFPSISLALSNEDTLLITVRQGLEINLGVDLFNIAGNVILAPTLVLVTTGLRLAGFIKSLISIVGMGLCHTLVILSLVLKFLIDQQSRFIQVEFSDTLISMMNWLHTFDGAQMAYVFFPFFVWSVICFREISQLIAVSDLRKNKLKKPVGPNDRKQKSQNI